MTKHPSKIHSSFSPRQQQQQLQRPQQSQQHQLHQQPQQDSISTTNSTTTPIITASVAQDHHHPLFNIECSARTTENTMAIFHPQNQNQQQQQYLTSVAALSERCELDTNDYSNGNADGENSVHSTKSPWRSLTYSTTNSWDEEISEKGDIGITSDMEDYDGDEALEPVPLSAVFTNNSSGSIDKHFFQQKEQQHQQHQQQQLHQQQSVESFSHNAICTFDSKNLSQYHVNFDTNNHGKMLHLQHHLKYKNHHQYQQYDYCHFPYTHRTDATDNNNRNYRYLSPPSSSTYYPPPPTSAAGVDVLPNCPTPTPYYQPQLLHGSSELRHQPATSPNHLFPAVAVSVSVGIPPGQPPSEISSAITLGGPIPPLPSTTTLPPMHSLPTNTTNSCTTSRHLDHHYTLYGTTSSPSPAPSLYHASPTFYSNLHHTQYQQLHNHPNQDGRPLYNNNSHYSQHQFRHQNYYNHQPLLLSTGSSDTTNVVTPNVTTPYNGHHHHYLSPTSPFGTSCGSYGPMGAFSPGHTIVDFNAPSLLSTISPGPVQSSSKISVTCNGLSAPVLHHQQHRPRPSIYIPPRGIGPVYDINDNDVLSGRGGRINVHTGNVQFRIIVAQRKSTYLLSTTKKLDKAYIAADIVHYIRYVLHPPGRFLKEDDNERGAWYDIGDARAIKKVGQALREDAPEIRAEHQQEQHQQKDLDGTERESSTTPRCTTTTSASIVETPTTFESLATKNNAIDDLNKSSSSSSSSDSETTTKKRKRSTHTSTQKKKDHRKLQHKSSLTSVAVNTTATAAVITAAAAIETTSKKNDEVCIESKAEKRPSHTVASLATTNEQAIITRTISFITSTVGVNHANEIKSICNGIESNSSLFESSFRSIHGNEVSSESQILTLNSSAVVTPNRTHKLQLQSSSAASETQLVTTSNTLLLPSEHLNDDSIYHYGTSPAPSFSIMSGLLTINNKSTHKAFVDSDQGAGSHNVSNIQPTSTVSSELFTRLPESTGTMTDMTERIHSMLSSSDKSTMILSSPTLVSQQLDNNIIEKENKTSPTSKSNLLSLPSLVKTLPFDEKRKGCGVDGAYIKDRDNVLSSNDENNMDNELLFGRTFHPPRLDSDGFNYDDEHSYDCSLLYSSECSLALQSRGVSTIQPPVNIDETYTDTTNQNAENLESYNVMSSLIKTNKLIDDIQLFGKWEERVVTTLARCTEKKSDHLQLSSTSLRRCNHQSDDNTMHQNQVTTMQNKIVIKNSIDCNQSNTEDINNTRINRDRRNSSASIFRNVVPFTSPCHNRQPTDSDDDDEDDSSINWDPQFYQHHIFSPQYHHSRIGGDNVQDDKSTLAMNDSFSSHVLRHRLTSNSSPSFLSSPTTLTTTIPESSHINMTELTAMNGSRLCSSSNCKYLSSSLQDQHRQNKSYFGDTTASEATSVASLAFSTTTIDEQSVCTATNQSILSEISGNMLALDLTNNTSSDLVPDKSASTFNTTNKGDMSNDGNIINSVPLRTSFRSLVRASPITWSSNNYNSINISFDNNDNDILPNIQRQLPTTPMTASLPTQNQQPKLFSSIPTDSVNSSRIYVEATFHRGSVICGGDGGGAAVDDENHSAARNDTDTTLTIAPVCSFPSQAYSVDKNNQCKLGENHSDKNNVNETT